MPVQLLNPETVLVADRVARDALLLAKRFPRGVPVREHCRGPALVGLLVALVGLLMMHHWQVAPQSFIP